MFTIRRVTGALLLLFLTACVTPTSRRPPGGSGADTTPDGAIPDAARKIPSSEPEFNPEVFLKKAAAGKREGEFKMTGRAVLRHSETNGVVRGRRYRFSFISRAQHRFRAVLYRSRADKKEAELNRRQRLVQALFRSKRQWYYVKRMTVAHVNGLIALNGFPMRINLAVMVMRHELTFLSWDFRFLKREKERLHFLFRHPRHLYRLKGEFAVSGQLRRLQVLFSGNKKPALVDYSYAENTSLQPDGLDIRCGDNRLTMSISSVTNYDTTQLTRYVIKKPVNAIEMEF